MDFNVQQIQFRISTLTYLVRLIPLDQSNSSFKPSHSDSKKFNFMFSGSSTTPEQLNENNSAFGLRALPSLGVLKLFAFV